MRIKLFIIALSILLIASSCSQKANIPQFIPTNSENYPSDAFDYPGRARQIPESILDNMSTRGLVVSVLNYPALPEIHAYNTPQAGFEAVTSKFNGLQELMRRSDAGAELFTIYRSMDPADISTDWELARQGRYVSNFKTIEIILSQESILDGLTAGELRELMREVKKKYETKIEVEAYGNRAISTSLLLFGRILKKVNFEPYKSEVLKNEVLEEFMDNGFYLDEKSSNLIISCMKKYMHQTE